MCRCRGQRLGKGVQKRVNGSGAIGHLQGRVIADIFVFVKNRMNSYSLIAFGVAHLIFYEWHSQRLSLSLLRPSHNPIYSFDFVQRLKVYNKYMDHINRRVSLMCTHHKIVYINIIQIHCESRSWLHHFKCTRLQMAFYNIYTQRVGAKRYSSSQRTS